MIRLPDIPGLQETRIDAPQVSIEAATAPARGLTSIARGIASLGESFEQIAERTQSFENTRAESEARNRWMRGYGALKLELEKSTDPADHLRRVDEFLHEQKNTLDQPDLAPVVRDKLILQFDDFATRAKNDTAAGAARLAARRATEALNNDFDTAAESANPAAWARARDTALEQGILLPEQAEKMDLEFNQRSAFSALSKEIEADPIGANELLEEPDILSRYPVGSENLERLKRHAATQANHANAAMWDGILNQALNEGTDQKILSKDDLRQLAEDGTISPEQRASYIAAYHGADAPAFDPHIYNTAFAAISAYDPAQDPTGAAVANLRAELATLPLPKEHVAELRDRLGERLKPDDKSTHKLAGDFAKLTTEAFNSGRFGSWFTYGDHDNDPRTMNRKIITPGDYGRALATKRRFTDAWDAYLRNQPEGIDPVKAQETYDQLFERIVLDADEPEAGPLIPGAPPAVDVSRDVESLLGTPPPATGTPTNGKETSAVPRGTFGGQRIQPVGTFYRNARPTIFGGKADPSDNGLSAFGGATGAGGKEGVAIPHDVLRATFPGKDKAWFAKNVRAVVKTDDGRQAVLPVADLGTAEWVWKRDKRPVLDLTEGAVKQLGGRPVYKEGKLAGISGLGSLSFALTTANAGPDVDLRGMEWDAAQDAWFADKKPTNADQIAAGLAALRREWLLANADDDAPDGGVLPPRPDDETAMADEAAGFPPLPSE